MSKISKVVASMAALPVLAIAPLAHATGNGQIEQGDIYRVKNVTANSSFVANGSAACGDTVEYRVRIHNGGPETITNVKVSATLNTASSTSHGSQVSLSADNNLHNAVVTANAGVNTPSATTATYVSGSTQLLNYSATAGNESVIKNLPDGILSGGVNIGNIGPLTADTEEVQFQAKLACATPTPIPTPAPTQTPTPAAPAKAPEVLPNTGAGDVLGAFAGASAAGTAAHAAIRRVRRNK
jgi:uncharacterized repeat protein (TIGR01451 family)